MMNAVRMGELYRRVRNLLGVKFLTMIEGLQDDPDYKIKGIQIMAIK